MADPSLAQDAKESDDAFRAQFDPSNPEHHGSSDTRVINTSSVKAVPKGMEDHANWQDLPEVAPEPQDFGPEWERLKTLREGYNNVKKAVGHVNVRLAASLSKPGNAALAQSFVDGVGELEAAGAKYFEAGSEDRAETDAVLAAANTFVGDARPSDPETLKEQHQQFKDQTKKFTTRLFADARKLLAEMKAAKKEYLEKK